MEGEQMTHETYFNGIPNIEGGVSGSWTWVWGIDGGGAQYDEESGTTGHVSCEK
jgi:hypothetical protein